MIFKKFLKNLHKLSISDWGIFKLCLVAFTLMLAVLMPDLISIDRWIYAIIFVVSYIYIIKKISSK